MVIVPLSHVYFAPDYTEDRYQYLEHAFNTSQYRLKNPKSVIPDETVFSYAAGAYLRGVDPIYINSEHTPLGKYIIALSIHFLKNENFPTLIFGIFSLIILWLLSRQVLKDVWIALLPPIFLLHEQVFLDQFRYIPLLDIIQLPFILLTLLTFIIELKKKKFVWTAISIGLVMSVKTPIAGILLVGTFLFYFLVSKAWKDGLRFSMFLPISFVPLFLSYTKTFIDGYSLSQFIGFMKWIILYQQSKLEYPFSVWRLVYLNQWQTWWGDRSFLQAVDWQISWPIFTTLAFGVGIAMCLGKIKTFPALTVLVLWSFVYGAFLSLGVISSRFFLPFLPVLYIIGIYGVTFIVTKVFRKL
jgi:hypothetical protein